MKSKIKKARLFTAKNIRTYGIRYLFNRRAEELKLRFITYFYLQSPGKYCWHDCINWALHPNRFNPFNIGKTINRGCKEQSLFSECSCGTWQKGECAKRLSAKQIIFKLEFKKFHEANMYSTFLDSQTKEQLQKKFPASFHFEEGEEEFPLF